MVRLVFLVLLLGALAKETVREAPTKVDKELNKAITDKLTKAPEVVAIEDASTIEKKKAEQSVAESMAAEKAAALDYEKHVAEWAVKNAEDAKTNPVQVEVGASSMIEGTSTPSPISCMDAKIRGISNTAGNLGSGVYKIDPADGAGAIDLWCDMDVDGGGWMVIQKRQDGSVDFYRTWSDYKYGFGNVGGEYWLGLDKISRLTRIMPTKLRVDLIGWPYDARWGLYQNFMVYPEANNYQLLVNTFVDGGIGDSLTYASGWPFSTYDRDNDGWWWNCAVSFHGAWWYTACHASNLNGKYFPNPGSHSSYADGADWWTWKGHFQSYQKVEMKIK
jgi:hypothetical protein